MGENDYKIEINNIITNVKNEPLKSYIIFLYSISNKNKNNFELNISPSKEFFISLNLEIDLILEYSIFLAYSSLEINENKKEFFFKLTCEENSFESEKFSILKNSCLFIHTIKFNICGKNLKISPPKLLDLNKFKKFNYLIKNFDSLISNKNIKLFFVEKFIENYKKCNDNNFENFFYLLDSCSFDKNIFNNILVKADYNFKIRN